MKELVEMVREEEKEMEKEDKACRSVSGCGSRTAGSTEDDDSTSLSEATSELQDKIIEV